MSIGRRRNPPHFSRRHKNSTPTPRGPLRRPNEWLERRAELQALEHSAGNARFAKALRCDGMSLARIAALIRTTQTRVRELLRVQA